MNEVINHCAMHAHDVCNSIGNPTESVVDDNIDRTEVVSIIDSTKVRTFVSDFDRERVAYVAMEIKNAIRNVEGEIVRSYFEQGEDYRATKQQQYTMIIASKW